MIHGATAVVAFAAGALAGGVLLCVAVTAGVAFELVCAKVTAANPARSREQTIRFIGVSLSIFLLDESVTGGSEGPLRS